MLINEVIHKHSHIQCVHIDGEFSHFCYVMLLNQIVWLDLQTHMHTTYFQTIQFIAITA